MYSQMNFSYKSSQGYFPHTEKNYNNDNKETPEVIKKNLKDLIGKAVYRYLDKNQSQFRNEDIQTCVNPDYYQQCDKQLYNKMKDYFNGPQYKDLELTNKTLTHLKSYLYTTHDYAHEFVNPIESGLIDFISTYKDEKSNECPYQYISERIKYIDNVYKNFKSKTQEVDNTKGGKRKSMQNRKNGKTKKNRKNRRLSRRHTS